MYFEKGSATGRVFHETNDPRPKIQLAALRMWQMAFWTGTGQYPPGMAIDGEAFMEASLHFGRTLYSPLPRRTT